MDDFVPIQIDKDTIHDMLLYHIYVYGMDVDTTYIQLRCENCGSDKLPCYQNKQCIEHCVPTIYPFQFYMKDSQVVTQYDPNNPTPQCVFWTVRDYLQAYCNTCIRCGLRYSAYPDPLLTIINAERDECTSLFCLECVNSLHIQSCTICGKLPEYEPWEPVFLHDMNGQSNTLHCRKCDEQLNSSISHRKIMTSVLHSACYR